MRPSDDPADMAREVTHDETGPYIVEPEDFEEKGDVAVCLCGLSNDYPFCDGSHRVAEDESPGTTYKYSDDDPDAERRPIEEMVYAEE